MPHRVPGTPGSSGELCIKNGEFALKMINSAFTNDENCVLNDERFNQTGTSPVIEAAAASTGAISLQEFCFLY